MLQTIKFDKVLFGAVGDEIAKKVRASHAPSVMGRGFAEHVHGYQLVEALLPVCEKHGLVLALSDGEDKYPITKPADIIPVMNQCDEEWLCVQDGEVDEQEDGEATFVSILLIYGNNADDPEVGRGEMVADWSGCDEWYGIFDPILDAFIDNREVEEEEVTV
jgi:hypothetical protein